jgi:hypothetical protein
MEENKSNYHYDLPWSFGLLEDQHKTRNRIVRMAILSKTGQQVVSCHADHLAVHVITLPFSPDKRCLRHREICKILGEG